MYLIQLSSRPKGLFKTIDFKSGCNFIYGKKDDNNPKSSLNSIGKSTVLDLIDFCLLSSFTKSTSPRLDSAKEIMSGYEIVLDFKVGRKLYSIKRSVDNAKTIYFGELGDYNQYHIDDAKEILANLIFSRKEYSGIFNPKFIRALLGFYVKVHRFKKDLFSDPIKYIKEVSELELNVYHLFLLGLDNTLSFENFEKRSELKHIKPLIKEAKKYVAQKYNLDDIKTISNEVNLLKHQINSLERSLKIFRLADQYKNSEEEANALTKKIKEQLMENVISQKLINDLKESYELDDKINTNKIKRIYDEVNESLSNKLKVSLDEAIDFRKKISISRKRFLLDEINNLTRQIHQRDAIIKKLEDRRAQLFTFLHTQDAITDLTQSYLVLNEKRIQLSEIQSNTNLIEELEIKKTVLENDINKLKQKFLAFLRDNEDNISKLFNLFYDIYTDIYIDKDKKAGFSITGNSRKEKYLDIQVSVPDMFGKGKNHGRTLIYDLMVVINNIVNTNNFPRFLIHDGIFDGMDKAHFILIKQFIDSLPEQGVNIQYITTINEEGSLSEKFGNSEAVNPETIENEAVIVLTPSNKLLGEDF